MLFHDLIPQGNASCGTFFLSDCDSRAIGRLNESGVDQLSVSLPKLWEARMHEMEAEKQAAASKGKKTGGAVCGAGCAGPKRLERDCTTEQETIRMPAATSTSTCCRNCPPPE